MSGGLFERRSSILYPPSSILGPWFFLEVEIIEQVADIAQVFVGAARHVEHAAQRIAEALGGAQVGGERADREAAARDQRDDAGDHHAISELLAEHWYCDRADQRERQAQTLVAELAKKLLPLPKQMRLQAKQPDLGR